MDTASYVWTGLFAAGIFLGLFLRLKIVGIFIGIVLGLLLAGFLIGAFTGSQSMIWGAGVALMVAPAFGAVLFLGAALSNGVVRILRSKPNDKDSGG